MKIAKKLMALLLSLVMVAGTGAASAFAEGSTAPINALGGSDVFAKYHGKDDVGFPVGITSIKIDASKENEEHEVAVYRPENDGIIWNKKALELTNSVLSVDNEEVMSVSRETKHNARITIIPKKDGIATLTCSEGGIKLTLEVEITGVKAPEPPKPTLKYQMWDGVKNGQIGRVMSGVTYPYEQSTNPPQGNIGYHFKDTMGDNDASNDVDYSPAELPHTFAYTQSDTNKPQATQEQMKEMFRLAKTDEGQEGIRIYPLYVGTFYMTVTITTPKDDNVTLEPTTLMVSHKRGTVEYDIPEGESINKYLNDPACIPPVGSELYKTNMYALNLGDYTYAHEDDKTIVLDRPVVIRGVLDGKTTVQSNIIIDIPKRYYNSVGVEVKPQLKNLTLKSRVSHEGIGVTESENNLPNVFEGYRLAVDGYDVGVDMIHGPLRSFDYVRNCNIGLNVMPYSGGVSTASCRELKNNGTAIVIKSDNGNTNAFSLGFCRANFIGNRVNIDSSSTAVDYNFSFNYFDNWDDPNAFKSVRCSPYYRDPIIDPGNAPMIYPTKTYLLESEMNNVIEVSNKLLAGDTEIQMENANGKQVTLEMVEVTNEGVDKRAGWDFTKVESSRVKAFNPGIATELRSSSDAAIAKIPAGAKYQPVSFAHSGALPGTATVSVVKDADAPASNLKLYKVVGDRLVKQPDAVVFNEKGEFVFNRDSSSDYIITDTNLDSGSTDNGSTDSGSSGSSGGGYTDSGEVGSKLDSTPAGGTASIDVSAKPNVGAASFDLLKKDKSKTLVLKGDGYSWSFKGSDLTQSVPGLISVNTAISKASPNAEAIKKLTGDAPIMNVYFSYHGLLPGKATIELEVDKSLGNKPLNLYYYNSATGRLSPVHSGLAVKDGKVSFDITHCSDYLLTPNVIPGTGRLAMTSAVINPNTGR